MICWTSTLTPSEKIYERLKEKPHVYGIFSTVSEEQALDLVARERPGKAFNQGNLGKRDE